MELIRGLHNVRARHHGCVVTVGNFDGVHRGHQAMLALLRQHARELNVPATVVSFEPSPREFFATAEPPPRLTRFREKFEALAAYGVDRFLCLRFDAAIRALEPRDFILRILVRALGVGRMVIGPDFRFGRNRSGDIAALRAYAAEYGFAVTEMPAVLCDGERVSSSLVRSKLIRGELAHAERLLGRPYRISGRVVTGSQLGRQLGFPTANLRLRRRAVALNGIFAARISGAGLERAPAVVSLGTRPTVNGSEMLLEAHVFDFAGNLYRQYLHVDFVTKLRDEQRFATLEQLVEQMRVDAEQARALLS